MAKFILKKTVDPSRKKKILTSHRRASLKVNFMICVVIIETIFILTTIISR